MAASKATATLPSPFKKALPESLKVGRDRLLLRLDFYSEAIVMQSMGKKGGSFRMVSAHDVSHALASELSFASGLLPENTLWWANTRSGPVIAIWIEPGIHRLALQVEALQPPERYDVPLPGLIFLCRAGQPPHIYAASHRPAGPRDRVYKAPLANIYDDGRSCPGSHKYPADAGSIPDSFLRSFFTPGANLGGRSKKHPHDITRLWQELDKQEKYPLNDLVYHGTVKDIMEMTI